MYTIKLLKRPVDGNAYHELEPYSRRNYKLLMVFSPCMGKPAELIDYTQCVTDPRLSTD